MDVIAVRDLARPDRAWLLAADGREAVAAPGDTTCHGFGLPYPAPFAAAFAWQGRLWLQVGRDRWDMAEIAAVQQVSERAWRAKYRLVLHDGSAVEVVVRFPAGVATTRALSPMYDEIESLSDDPLKLLPYTAADGWKADPDDDVATWAGRARARWEAGV